MKYYIHFKIGDTEYVRALTSKDDNYKEHAMNNVHKLLDENNLIVLDTENKGTIIVSTTQLRSCVFRITLDGVIEKDESSASSGTNCGCKNSSV